MRKVAQTRLARLVEARRAQDGGVARQTIAAFLNGLTPSELLEFRQKPDVCREKLWAFLEKLPPQTLTAINRHHSRPRGR